MFGILRSKIVVKLNKLVSSDYSKLFPILVLAFFMAFIPHIKYAYAIHVDEWDHITYANALFTTGTVYHSFPFSGQGPTSGTVGLLESGYHIILAIFQRFSGIPWIDIARYAPSIIFVFTVLSVYIFAKKLWFGWEAAFFTCFIPTTVGILGPAFIVPVAMGLAFTPLLLFLVTNFQTKWAYPVICILISFLIILHTPSAILIVVLLLPFCIFNLKANPKQSLGILVAIALPFLLTLPWTASLILSEIKSIFTPTTYPEYHDLFYIISDYGYIPIIFFIIGSFILVLKGNWKNYGLVTSSIILLAMLTTFFTFHYGIELLYLRGLLFSMLIMSIIAGAGLMILRKFEIPWFTRPSFHLRTTIIKVTGISLCIITIAATMIVLIPERQNAPYYHMIDKTDYEAFIWIRDNVDASHQKAILDPWKATAFTALTEKYVYTRILINPTDISQKAYEFLEGGSKDTAFLVENGISIVYTRINNVEFTPDNPDLVEIRENVFLLKLATTDK